MNARRALLIAVFLAVCPGGFRTPLYGNEPVPAWLDTVPPVVRAEPAVKYHRTLFNVMFSANEPALLWYSRTGPDKLQRYHRPVTIARDGIYRFYFCGEDDFGNKSPVDSFVYVMDSRPPVFSVEPPPGTLRGNSRVTFRANEPCRFYLVASKNDSLREPLGESFAVTGTVDGYFAAVDSAGNRMFSDRVRYDVDTTRPAASIAPNPGIYRIPQQLTLTTPVGAEAWYTFDPLAPPEWFQKYSGPVKLPHGLTIVRFFVRSPSGVASEIGKVSYVLDTIAPKIQHEVRNGPSCDTLTLFCKENAHIRFTTDGSIPGETSPVVTAALLIVHTGISRIRAKAWDNAGNVSMVFTWEYKYDYVPPVITVSPRGGNFRAPFTVMLSANEPAKILYTINGKPVNESALLFSPAGIPITQQGVTELRFRGIDGADNGSAELIERYTLDTRPPAVRVRIQSDIAADRFTIHLLCDEPATIYYTVNGSVPTTGSSLYQQPLELRSSDVLRYFGVDSIGNAGVVAVVDELDKPIVDARPAGGLYNRRVRIGFDRTVEGTIWWRLLPDTLFRVLADTLLLDREGAQTLEYYLLSSDGTRSAIRRNEYYLDWTAPKVAIRVQRGTADSAVIFFDADENASVYFTADGTNPLFSATTRSAGNKFQRASDRVALRRDPRGRLAWYAEDAAGNQSALSILDVFNPHVVPSVPPGPERLYDRILAISLQSQEGTVIHYERHGRKPDLESPVYGTSITLTSSDTIVAFVVDGSGYRGEPESFIYRIDLPPSPQFTVLPETIYVATAITFDAGGTFDRESPPERLKYRWDFNGDGRYDTDSGYFPKVTHTYESPGMAAVLMQVIDEHGRKAEFRREIAVRTRCPSDMVPAFDGAGKAFCIDTYEWPNRRGGVPSVNVSWVEAKMACIDVGKRLCRRDEWVSVCRNSATSMYPYGDRYDPQRCVTEETAAARSGSKPLCTSAGVADMIGNAWEWIEDKQGDYVSAQGGSFRYGKDAHCLLKFDATVATRSGETGFRCCK